MEYMTSSELEDAINQAFLLQNKTAPGPLLAKVQDHFLELLKIQRMRASFVVFQGLTSSEPSVSSVAEKV